MTILVLDQERDLIWGDEGEGVSEDRLAPIRTHRGVHDGQISVLEYNDGVVLRVLCMGQLLLVTDSNSDPNRTAMAIKDVLMDNLTGHHAYMHRGLLKEMLSGQTPQLQQVALRCTEIISNVCMGTIAGRDSKQVCFKGCDNFKLRTRPGVRCSRVDDCLFVDISEAAPYYEQVRYEAKAELPCRIEKSTDGRTIQLRVTSTIDVVMQDLRIKIPAIRSIELKTLQPANLLHKCTVDDGGLTWTMSLLRPHTSYHLSVRSIESVGCACGFLSVEYECCSPGIFVDGQPMAVKRVYRSAPCFGE